MDAFSYLAVLFSIVLGLALQQVLEGLRALLLARRRVRLYAPALLWAALVLAVIAQTWWAMFGLRDTTQWSFAMYAVVLAHMMLVYLVAGLVLPDRGCDDTIDLKAGYFAHSRPFFLLLVALGFTSLAKDVVIEGRLPDTENLIFHALFVSLAAATAATRREWFHLANGVVATALFGSYVALLFARL